jgi:choline dehydrogenase-like flavoprotein
MTYDIILIGTGAGGGTLAHKLAPTGKKMLILERGDFLPKETQNWDPWAVAKGRYKTTEMWRDMNGESFSPYQHYWVGGNTKLYGGALLRLRESDFEEVRHYDGISPAWPLKYADFEPYYTQAEYLYHTRGQRGVDPTEPPATKPYPQPPLEFEPRMKEVSEAVRQQGYHPAPIPLAVQLPEGTDKVHLTLYDGYPDPTGSKADAHSIGIAAALKYPNVTLLTNRKAIRIETDNTGRTAKQVVVDHNGEMEQYSADVIVVACGAINSAALLLRSASDRHPNGLANGSGLVGRNLMLHNNGVVLAYSAKENPSAFQKAFLIPDFYHGAGDSEFPLGAIQLMGKADPLLLTDALGPELTANGKTLEYFAGHIVDFFITAEDLPLIKNQVLAREDGGIRLIYHQNNLEAYNRLRQKLIHIMDKVAEMDGVAGTTKYFGFKLGIGGVTHQTGTCRFGTDPSTSVLDLNCRAHELDNLYVVDTSFFPSCGAVNPSLTAMANALRVGDHLVERMNSGADAGVRRLRSLEV